MIGMWGLGVGMPHLGSDLILQVGSPPVGIHCVPIFLGAFPAAESLFSCPIVLGRGGLMVVGMPAVGW